MIRCHGLLRGVSGFLFASWLLWHAPLAAADSQLETQRLHDWLDERYEEELLRSPETLAYMGRKQRYGELDDYSEAALDAHVTWFGQTVVQLANEFDYQDLTPEGQTSYDFWVYRYQQEKEYQPFRRLAYIFDQEHASHTAPVEVLTSFHQVDSVADMESYIARINAIPAAVEQLLLRARLAAVQGIRPPRYGYERALMQCRNLLIGAPFPGDAATDSPIWADANARIEALRVKGELDEKEALALLSAVRSALLTKLQPAYEAIIAWIESDFENTDAIASGIASRPNGSAYYDFLIRHYALPDMTADDVHHRGLEEVDRIRAEITLLKQEVGFNGDLLAFFDFVRIDKQFYFPDTDAGRQEYLDTTLFYIRAMESRLPAYFHTPPKVAMEVKRPPSFVEAGGGTAYYRSPTSDGSRPGVYFVPLSDMNAMNKIDLETTAYHEGSPGHHLQTIVAQQSPEMPLFRTREWNSGYVEGWALYAEYLAREMGALQDPYMNLGRLVWELFRAVRMVVDTGLHAKGWSQRQAIDYAMQNSAVAESMIHSEIERYLAYPGQAVSYKVGMLVILDLRAQAQEALGSAFDIRDFHAAVLGGGSLPLPLLQRRVRQWVADSRPEAPDSVTD